MLQDVCTLLTRIGELIGAIQNFLAWIFSKVRFWMWWMILQNPELASAQTKLGHPKEAYSLCQSYRSLRWEAHLNHQCWNRLIRIHYFNQLQTRQRCKFPWHPEVQIIQEDKKTYRNCLFVTANKAVAQAIPPSPSSAMWNQAQLNRSVQLVCSLMASSRTVIIHTSLRSHLKTT